MIRAIIDARKLGDGGIGTYIENLVDGFIELRYQGRESAALSLLVSPELLAEKTEESDFDLTPDNFARPNFVGRNFDSRKLARWQSDGVAVYPAVFAKYSFGEYFSLARKNKELIKRHDVFHAPHYTLPYFIPISKVVTVHDIIHVTHPRRFYHKQIGFHLINSALKRADRVITVSELSSARIKETFGGIRPATVIYNALSRDAAMDQRNAQDEIVSRYDLAKSFCLFVGSDKPHKGLDILLDTYFSFGQQLPELIVVGSNYSSHVHSILAEMGIAEKVRFVGGLSAGDLAHFYRLSSAVIVPSREEGFGLVALEGLAAGVPVVCSPIETLREVCGDCAYYAQKLDAESLFHAIQFAFKTHTVAKSERGKIHANKFSRSASAAETLAVYYQAATKGGHEHSCLSPQYNNTSHLDDELTDSIANF